VLRPSSRWANRATRIIDELGHGIMGPLNAEPGRAAHGVRAENWLQLAGRAELD
jgi:hypothetical protein